MSFLYNFLNNEENFNDNNKLIKKKRERKINQHEKEMLKIKVYFTTLKESEYKKFLNEYPNDIYKIDYIVDFWHDEKNKKKFKKQIFT